jgi:hypothetical protein
MRRLLGEGALRLKDRSRDSKSHTASIIERKQFDWLATNTDEVTTNPTNHNHFLLVRAEKYVNLKIGGGRSMIEEGGGDIHIFVFTDLEMKTIDFKSNQ